MLLLFKSILYLRRLVLRMTRIREAHCVHISKMIKNNTSLTFLDLRLNEISDKGGQVIKQGIKILKGFMDNYLKLF